jgi:hypothetical protein
MVSSYFQLALEVHRAHSSAPLGIDPEPAASLEGTFSWSGSSDN